MVATDTSSLGLQQRRRALPLCPTPTAPGFCLSRHQATISQQSPEVDTDVRTKMTSLKGLPSLSELIQNHSTHRSTGFHPPTSVMTESLAVPETTFSLSEITAQHLSKDKDRYFEPVSSGGDRQFGFRVVGSQQSPSSSFVSYVYSLFWP